MPDDLAPAAPAAPVPDSNTPQPSTVPAPVAAPAASDPSAAPKAATQPEAPEEQKPKGRWSERVDQLTAVKHQQAAEIAALRQELSELHRPLLAPDPNNFEAQETHRLRTVMREERADSTQYRVQQLQQQTAQTRQAVFETKLAAVKDRIPDIDKVRDQFYSTVSISNEACDILAESDKAAEITAFLVGNQGEAQRIAQLTPQRQMVEIARLEARVGPATVRRVSQAPEPPPTLGGGAPATARDPSGMTMEQYAVWYKTRGKTG